MSNKSLVIGLAVGLGIGAIIGLLYAPESGEDSRRWLRGKTQIMADALGKLMFNLKWLLMSPRERYLYLWHRGGSLRELRQEHVMPAPEETPAGDVTPD